MKIFIPLAAVVAIASAAAEPLSSLTPCPRDCLSNAIKKETTCSAEDAQCLCESHTRAAFQVDATQCINSKCTNQEGQDGQDWVTNLCAGLPLPSGPDVPGPTPEQIQAAIDEYNKLPACGFKCLNTAIISDKACELDDHFCQCSPQNIFRLSDAATPCLTSDCTSAEMFNVQEHLSAVCAAVGLPLGGDGGDGESPATTSSTSSTPSYPTGYPNYNLTTHATITTTYPDGSVETRTAYTTNTIYSCAETVHNCPYGPHTTKTDSAPETPTYGGGGVPTAGPSYTSSLITTTYTNGQNQTVTRTTAAGAGENGGAGTQTTSSTTVEYTGAAATPGLGSDMMFAFGAGGLLALVAW